VLVMVCVAVCGGGAGCGVVGCDRRRCWLHERVKRFATTRRTQTQTRSDTTHNPELIVASYKHNRLA